MPYQINLLDATLQRQREPLGSAVGLFALAGTAAVAVVAALVLHTLSAGENAQALAVEQAVADLQARASMLGAALPPSAEAVELAHLRATEAVQQRMRAALGSGQAGSTQGYGDYLMALSRQTHAGLWLTSFSVGADGRSIELGGRMTDPRQLPDYLRHLNAEPLFKGREFSQLSLSTIDPDGGASGGGSGGGSAEAARDADAAGVRVTEFALRASAGAANTADAR